MGRRHLLIPLTPSRFARTLADLNAHRPMDKRTRVHACVPASITPGKVDATTISQRTGRLHHFKVMKRWWRICKANFDQYRSPITN